MKNSSPNFFLQPESSMEYRVKAKVAAMPKISKAADDYHQTHPDWRETLIKLIQLAGSKMKKKRRKMRGKGKSRKKKPEERANEKKQAPRKVEAEDDGTGRFDASNFPEPPRMENLVANTDSSGGENEWNTPNVRFGSSSEGEPSSEEEQEEDLNLRKTSNNLQTRRKKERGLPNEEVEIPSQKRGRIIETSQERMKKPFVEEKLKEPIKRKAVNSGKSQEKLPENVKPNLAHEAKKMKMDSYDEPDESDIEEQPQGSVKPHNVDPFFMTSDNKEYKTLWKVEPADSFKNKDKDKEKESVFAFKNARTYQDVISGKPARPNKPMPNKKEKRPVKPEQGKLDPAKLHPSWQAKKKLNLATAPFQGKKIVFGDD